jgi:hypothetical protein
MESPQIFINNSLISPEINLHLLPVNIQHNGNAKVTKFFKIEEDPELLMNGNPTLKAKFRGRQFRGAIQEIPEGYKGFLLREEEHQRDAQEKAEHNKNWNNVGKFSKFTYWMREDVPSQGDSIQRCLNWLPLSKAIHSPLSHKILNQPVLYGTSNNEPNNSNNQKEKILDTSLKRKVESKEDANKEVNGDDASVKKRKMEEEETKK